MRLSRTSIAALATVALAGIGTGSALAATGTSTATTPAQQQEAVITALAGKLNITADALKSALVATAKERVAAALKAGDITQAQADAANARIDAGQGLLGPIGGPGKGGLRGPGGPGGGAAFTTAATFLGMTQTEIQTALQSGKTLADLAKAKGKTAADLEDAIVKADTAKINADTNLTDAQKKQILSDLSARVKQLVENAAPQGGPGFGGGRGGHGHGGPGRDGFGGSSSQGGSSSLAPLSSGTGA